MLDGDWTGEYHLFDQAIHALKPKQRLALNKQYKLSPMDLESRSKWVESSRAKDDMFSPTNIKQAPWYVVDADNKKRARLNVIHHLLGLVSYEDLTPDPITLPARQEDKGYVRPPLTDQTFVPEIY